MDLERSLEDSEFHNGPVSELPEEEPNETAPAQPLTSQDDPFFTFLAKIKLESFWGSIIDNGYDDFEYFRDSMELDDVKSMLNEIGMTLKGNVQRVVGQWRLLRHGKESSTSSSPPTQPTTTVLPPEIQRLLLPNPVSNKNIHFNNTTHSIFNDNSKLMHIHQLIDYITSQRHQRYQLEETLNTWTKFLIDCGEEGESVEKMDGNLSNVRKFRKLKSLSYADAAKAKTTVAYLNTKTKMAEKFLDEVTKKRELLLQGRLVDWKSNELAFYAGLLKKLEDVITSLRSLAGNIESLCVNSRCVQDLVAIAATKQKERSSAKNSKKAQSRQEERDRASAVGVLNTILHTEKTQFDDKIKNKDFTFVVLDSDIDFTKFESLLYRTHHKGLELLVEKDVFEESRKVKRYLMIMEKRYTDAADRRQDQAVTAKKKKQENAKQLKISFKPV